MRSTFTVITAAVFLAASHASADPVAAPAPAPSTIYSYKTLVYQGCFSSSNGLSLNTSYIYQTKGYCQTVCVPLNQAVLATSSSTDCYCGDEIPPASSKVDDSSCNDPCAGYNTEMCGGIGFYSVYLTGTANSAPNADAAASSSVASSIASATTSAKPSVVTVGGQTIVVTATGSAANASTSASSSSGGPSKAGIAAGVVVGIVAISAIAGGLFMFLRHRKRREVEEEYRRNAAVSSFIGSGKPTSSAGVSSLTDTRLDPAVMAQRRMSDGSIADNQDYSRRILKVTNA